MGIIDIEASVNVTMQVLQKKYFFGGKKKMKTSKIAARWWANQLRKEIPEEEEKIKLFENLLVGAIDKFLKVNKFMELNSDKEPRYITSIFAEKAGLKGKNVFPENTWMFIDKTKVRIVKGDVTVEVV